MSLVGQRKERVLITLVEGCVRKQVTGRSLTAGFFEVGDEVSLLLVFLNAGKDHLCARDVFLRVR